MSDKVAVVTGSNKGIGFSIVKELCASGVGVVYLTARDVSRGRNAIEQLKSEGFNPQFHQLEVNNKDSVKKFADHLKSAHGGVDVLINNAAITNNSFFETTHTFEDSKNVIDVNYRSVLTIQEYMFPILKENARVINISSDCGHITNVKNPKWIKELTKDDIKVEEVTAFVDWFLDCVKNGILNKEDFAEMTFLPYRVSKVALCALTRAQQKLVGKGISVNSLHPGFVQTDMTKGAGFMTLKESGKAPAYLALDVDQSVKGKYFWFDMSEKDWSNPDLDLYCRFEKIEHFLKEAGVH